MVCEVSSSGLASSVGVSVTSSGAGHSSGGQAEGCPVVSSTVGVGEGAASGQSAGGSACSASGEGQVVGVGLGEGEGLLVEPALRVGLGVGGADVSGTTTTGWDC